jgi:hypothetical protein
MMTQDLTTGDIWRKQGEIHEEGFYERECRPLSVIVWGAIGVNFRGPLIRCPSSVNQDSCRAILSESQIFRKLSGQFGDRGF